jgi:uncharacterized cupredoxin-like copper-binding protein
MLPVRRVAACTLAALAVAPPAALGGVTIETVKVRMSEYRIRLDRGHVNRSYFIFDMRNTGKVEHEFVIVKTARTAKRLPVANGQVSRRGWKGPVPLQPGEHKNVVFPNLRPGHYVLLCGIAGHYQKGMRRDFTLR